MFITTKTTATLTAVINNIEEKPTRCTLVLKS
jgi:hypothetical protein